MAAAAVCLRGALVMTKLSRAVAACISATLMLPSATFIAVADTFTYELNGSGVQRRSIARSVWRHAYAKRIQSRDQ